MVCEVSVTGRTFLKTIGSGALTVTVSTVTSLLDGCVTRPSESQSSPRLTGSTSHEAARPDQTTHWAPEPGQARWRIEGVSKVTGAKIYASDFKAADFEGWPKQENWLYALRCDRVNQVVVNFNLNVLPRGLQPIAVITSDTLERDDIPTSGDSNPDFKAGIELFARRGKPAGCDGQSVALLIFDSFDIYRHARKLLDFNPHVIQYGASEPAQTDAPGSFDDNANPFKQAKIYVRNDERQFWNTKMEPDLSGNPSDAFAQRCRHERDIITSLAASHAEAGHWREFGTADGNIFETPAMDPMFMEPESGLAWYVQDSMTMWLVLGTQSASDDGTTAISLFGKSTLHSDHAHVIACYPGGGFGGRDKSYFPAYLALAARFAKCPLRWQLSRYEQFQVGLKRSETRFEETIWNGTRPISSPSRRCCRAAGTLTDPTVTVRRSRPATRQGGICTVPRPDDWRQPPGTGLCRAFNAAGFRHRDDPEREGRCLSSL
ncbi:xanthine dehydrogenase family protein molybdopterin-binding subunit [Paraburkholderia sp. UYCP14C]|uniref:molybdopterin cofactor-binding domain-containing protein n=1 Tax=Paraburkholderia sp. UYCP14C TaxID=2511130 RepID=UPI0010206AB2|nr:molybdopterin cofactor-binding domain-containing protein [Paraburkholderia sp. UYCP14C]RZF24332.1 xanthine dehydrogenase family protein molybdopterin-binding subunit [Paraburkholderia sp. UYCP14C]